MVTFNGIYNAWNEATPDWRQVTFHRHSPSGANAAYKFLSAICDTLESIAQSETYALETAKNAITHMDALIFADPDHDEDYVPQECVPLFKALNNLFVSAVKDLKPEDREQLRSELYTTTKISNVVKLWLNEMLKTWKDQAPLPTSSIPLRMSNDVEWQPVR